MIPKQEIRHATNEGRLDGWDEVASFFGRGLRTIQRWEKEGSLPIHRLFKGRRSLVHAYCDELKHWVRERENHPVLLSHPTPVSPPPGDALFSTPRDVLAGWKEIAAFIGRSVNTAQRWEKELSLPVRRLKSTGRSIPFALRSELTAWLKESTIRAGSAAEGGVSALLPPILRALFDGYNASIALLDDKGTVVAVNKSWKELSASQGDRYPRFGLGKNYLELCKSTAWGGVDPASATAEGIIAVLTGTRREFIAKYSGDGSGKKCWFTLHLMRFNFRGTTRIVAAHNEVTGLLAD